MDTRVKDAFKQHTFLDVHNVSGDADLKSILPGKHTAKVQAVNSTSDNEVSTCICASQMPLVKKKLRLLGQLHDMHSKYHRVHLYIKTLKFDYA